MSVLFGDDRDPEIPGGLPADGAVLGEVEGFLRRAVGQMRPAEEGAPRRPGRPRVLPSMCLWAGMLVCVLRGMGSQLDLWRLLASKGLWEYPRFGVTDQAVYSRLAREGTEPLEGIFGHVSALLRERLAPYELRGLAGFAAGVVAIDQSTMEKVARLLPALRGAAPKELVAGKLSGVFDIRAQQWRRVSYTEDANENEKVSAREMLEGLPPTTVVLFDLGYFSFGWFDHLTDSGYHYVSRLRTRTSYEVIHVHHEDRQRGAPDCVVWLGRHRADRAAHAVRLVRFRAGGRTHSYITNVLDPGVLPAHEVPRLYVRRWDFELAMKLAKRELGLHLLWGCKPVVVRQQVWAVLIVAQVLQALRMEVAGRAGAEVDEVSMGLLVRYMPRFAARGLDPVAEFVGQGRALGFIRPSRRIERREPRASPDLIAPLPPGLALRRAARYAGRRCDARGDSKD